MRSTFAIVVAAVPGVLIDLDRGNNISICGNILIQLQIVTVCICDRVRVGLWVVFCRFK